MDIYAKVVPYDALSNTVHYMQVALNPRSSRETSAA